MLGKPRGECGPLRWNFQNVIVSNRDLRLSWELKNSRRTLAPAGGSIAAL